MPRAGVNYAIGNRGPPEKHARFACAGAPGCGPSQMVDLHPARGRRGQRTAHRQSFAVLPPEAIAQGIEGEAILMLRFGSSGQLINAEVAKSSGHAILDEAALRAIRATPHLAAGPGKCCFPSPFPCANPAAGLRRETSPGCTREKRRALPFSAVFRSPGFRCILHAVWLRRAIMTKLLRVKECRLTGWLAPLLVACASISPVQAADCTATVRSRRSAWKIRHHADEEPHAAAAPVPHRRDRERTAMRRRRLQIRRSYTLPNAPITRPTRVHQVLGGKGKDFGERAEKDAAEDVWSAEDISCRRC